MTRPRFMIVGALVAASLAACAGGSDSSSYQQPKGPSQQTVKIEGGNLYFKPETVRLPAGIDTIELDGAGGVHTLVIERVSGFKLRVEGDGDTDSLKVKLEPGRYTYYCDIPGHRDAGMEGTIRVS